MNTLLPLAGVPVLVSVVLGLGAPWLGNRLPPGVAVKLIAVTAFATALATGFCLSVVAFTALARIPPVAAAGQWSAENLGVEGAPPPFGGAILGLAVVALLVTALRRSVVAAKELGTVILACRHLLEVSPGLVVVEDEVPDAFAVPGLRGRIVVTTGMLAALTPPEREVLLAHEHAHLRRHHQLYVQAASLAAAANPLLRPAAAQVHKLSERWADEDAASTVGDRQLAARALAKAGLARARNTEAVPQSATLAAATGHVGERVLALTRPALRSRPRLVVVVAALGVVNVLAAAWAGHTTEGTFEYAHAAYLTQRVPDSAPGRTRPVSRPQGGEANRQRCYYSVPGPHHVPATRTSHGRGSPGEEAEDFGGESCVRR